MSVRILHFADCHLGYLPAWLGARAEERADDFRRTFARLVDVACDAANAIDLVIIAGRPSMGKTSFALNLAEHAAIHHHKNVALLSLEMSKEQLVLRMLCSQAEVPLFKVRSGHLSDAEFRRLVNLTGGLYKAPIWIDDSPLRRPG